MANRPENAIAPDQQALIDAFEEAWKEGQTPQIRDFLSPTPGGSGAAAPTMGTWCPAPALMELVLVDLWHRWRRAKISAEPAAPAAAPAAVDAKTPAAGLPARPLLEDYVREFPEIGPLRELPLDAVAEEYRARLRWSSGVTEAEYVARFPAYAEELPARLAAVGEEVYGLLKASDPWTIGSTAQHTPLTASPAAPVASPTPGGHHVPRVIGRYQIIGMLDEGGQARVYRAVHPQLAREVVIKLGRNPIEAAQTVEDCLLAESRMLAELDDPAIARVFDAGIHEGLPYMVMEYVRGRHLWQYFEQCRPNPRQSAAIIAGAARGLAKAHARGITHQDLKPKNIVIDERGQPRILDFGLATFRHAWHESTAEPGTISGTPEYMPPEQAAGQTGLLGPRSDIFALGGVLYFLLVGHAPFQGKDVLDSLAKARACDFDSAALRKRKIPAALARICLRAMQARPQARYQTAEAMADDLEHFLSRPRRIRRAILAVGVGGLLLAVAGLAWKLYLSTGVGHHVPMVGGAGPAEIDLASPPADQAKGPWLVGLAIGMLAAILAACGGVLLLRKRRALALQVAGATAPLAAHAPAKAAAPADHAYMVPAGLPTIFLRVVSTPYAYQAPAAAQTVTIGRQRRKPGMASDEGNDFVIRVPDSDDQSLRISRRHLEIQKIGNECYVIDRSRAGTQLDGKALVMDQPTPLRSGSQLVLAGVIVLEFLVQVESLAIARQPCVSLAPSAIRRMPLVMEASVGDMITLEAED